MAASGKRITRLSRATLRADADKLRTLAGRTDAEVEAEVAADPLAAPVIAGDGWRGAELIMPEQTVVVSLRIDRAVLEHFKAAAPTAPEAAMAAALKAWLDAQE
ncbi:hypothetical protein [Caenispirillum bisanense]|uniref:BrnA antitoxin of type II toxin-antitoxin system n=1 Tax=Caenispirillum bisanense TaxID=414052 RepID=A0A286G5T1_9PROT|nr:hypothetical protein [Caenispirillum bisanense]SOD90832.1 hypothetical protein SAMN05421508_101677 [Caenispirillum bisanense]